MGRRTKKSSKKATIIHYLPVYGCISNGIIYFAVGTIALLSFFRVKHGGADESSLMAFLNNYVAGKILVCIILLGTISYIIWRIYESIRDPYKYGSDGRGISLRTGIALSIIPDLLISYSALLVLLGIDHFREDGQPIPERNFVQEIFSEPWGGAVIIVLGCIIVLAGIIQLVYGLSKGYKERIDIAHFSAFKKHLVHALAWFGYTARGVILGIIGVFCAIAGFSKDSSYIVNTDKAFDFVGDHVGHAFFIILAIGTISYGIFMFALAVAYDVD